MVMSHKPVVMSVVMLMLMGMNYVSMTVLMGMLKLYSILYHKIGTYDHYS